MISIPHKISNGGYRSTGYCADILVCEYTAAAADVRKSVMTVSVLACDEVKLKIKC